MRSLSPSQYNNWPTYAQRIVFAYNSVPHESIDHLSPNEMDFASPLQSPFGPPAPDLTFPDLEDPPNPDPTPDSSTRCKRPSKPSISLPRRTKPSWHRQHKLD